MLQSTHPFKTAAIPSLAIPPAYGIAPLCREPTSFSSNLWSSFKLTNRRGLKSGTAKLRIISALQRDSGSIGSGERHEVVLKVVALLLSFNPFLFSLLYYSNLGQVGGEEVWETQAHPGRGS